MKVLITLLPKEKFSKKGDNDSGKSKNISSKGKKELVFIESNKCVVFIKSPPRQGKANEELLKKIAKYFKKDLEKIKIVAGFTGRKKVVYIED